MDAKYIEKQTIRLVGIATIGKPEETVPQIPAIWDRYMLYDEQLKPYSPDKAYYGAWINDPSHDPSKAIYLAGMHVENLPAIPAGLEEHILPAAKYAVFDCTVSTIGPTYDKVYGEWLPASPYEYNMAAADFEYYPPDTTNGESRAQVFIPIKEKQPQTA